MAFPLCVIGGSGLTSSTLFSLLTPASQPPISYLTSSSLVYINRHHTSSDYTPPHLINHQAIWTVIKTLSPSLVLGMCSVGTLRPHVLPIGTLVVADDWLCYNTQPVSLNPSAHYRPILDAKARASVLDILVRQQLPVSTQPAVYVETRGPRFETKAEVRAMAQLGHVVGMTGGAEASLACELKVPYVLLCMVDNLAHGLGRDEAIASPEAFKRSQQQNMAVLESALAVLVQALAPSPPPLVSFFPCETLILARFVATVDGADTVIQHGLVAVSAQGDICGVHAAHEAPPYQARAVVRLPDSLLIPGLINAHTHVGMTLLRGFGDDLELVEWLTTRIWPAEAKLASPDFVFDSTLQACEEMLLAGTTTFAEMYFFPDACLRAVLQAHMRCVLGLVIVDFPTPMATGGADCLAQAKSRLVQSSPSPLVSFAVAPHAPYSVSADNMRLARSLARECDCGFMTHLHECAEEVRAAVQGDKKSSFCHQSPQACRPLQALHEEGLVDERCVLAHMVHVSEADMAMLAQTRASVAHCPSSNLKLASGLCPVSKLLASGVNVCLGTDGAASNNSLDMLAELKLACLLAKGVAGDATALPAKLGLRLATANGAKALGLDKLVGSIEAGKRADLVAIRLLDAPACRPVYDPVSALVYAASSRDISHVWVDGKLRVEAGVLLGARAEADSRSTAEMWQARVEAVREELLQV